MAVKDILLLGNPKLYEVSQSVEKDEIGSLMPQVGEMFNTIVEFREKYGAGRAMAAPQIGLQKRIICLNMDKPVVMINPELIRLSEEMFEVWDDCMSFSNLLVKVLRHKSITIKFYDENWNQHQWELKDDMAELLQHEYDHLDGILATQRAMDDKSFLIKN